MTEDHGFKLAEGLVQVYTGDGKGKTTAALGLGLRAAGNGLKVLIVQFVKGRETGELHAVKAFGERFRIKQFGAGRFIIGRPPTADELLQAKEALEYATAEMNAGRADLLILDEISHAVNTGLVNLADLRKLITNRPRTVEIVLTGRNMPRELLELSDLISEIRAVKHPFAAGKPARRGIEY